jgi:hypothetical protein
MIFRHVYKIHVYSDMFTNIFRHVYKIYFRHVYKIYSDMFTKYILDMFTKYIQACLQWHLSIFTMIFRYVLMNIGTIYGYSYKDIQTCLHWLSAMYTCSNMQEGLQTDQTRHIYNYIQKLFQWHSCVVQCYSDMYLSILKHFEPPCYKWPDHSLYLEISKLFVLVVILTNIQNSNFELTIARLLTNSNHYQYIILFDLAVIHAVKIVTILTISKYFL